MTTDQRGQSPPCSRVPPPPPPSSVLPQPLPCSRVLLVHVGSLSGEYDTLSVEVGALTTVAQLISCVAQQLHLSPAALQLQLAAVCGTECGRPAVGRGRRVLAPGERPVQVYDQWLLTAATSATSTARATSTASSNSSLTHPRFLLVDSMAGVSPPPLSGDNRRLPPPLTSSGGARLANKPRPLDLHAPRVHNSAPRLPTAGTPTPATPTSATPTSATPTAGTPTNDASDHADLCQLTELSVDTILHSLRCRFNSGHIYTYVNSMLIGLNPFAYLGIYNPKWVDLYRNRSLHELPPHIFAIADAAYQRLLCSAVDQSVVITGESGSGKTQAFNLVVHHLTALSHKSAGVNVIEQTLLAAGPVLEAFGNAKTSVNDNSSRFGKYVQVKFQLNGQVKGAVVQKYLLERSRIVSQSLLERNYHVFYYMLCGMSDEQRAKLHLRPGCDYHYLKQRNDLSLDSELEQREFSRLVQSMETVGFSSDQRNGIFSLLSAVLLLGNVTFSEFVDQFRDGCAHVENTELVAHVSQLLQLDQQLLLDALTKKQTRMSDDLVVMNYDVREATAARDTLAKCLYTGLFDWIVVRLNRALAVRTQATAAPYGGAAAAAPLSSATLSIGILDIFGFEDLGDSNSFEQFCINYANERLQHYFNHHMFRYEQFVYESEGIQWRSIDYPDNSACLQLFENRQHGLLNILDDICSFRGATNETLLKEFNKLNASNQCYDAPTKFEQTFFINHYASKVKYQIGGFREKNMNIMPLTIVSLLKSSQTYLVHEMMSFSPRALRRWSLLRHLFHALAVFRRALAAAGSGSGAGGMVGVGGGAGGVVGVGGGDGGVADLCHIYSANMVSRGNTTAELASARSHFEQLIDDYRYSIKASASSISGETVGTAVAPNGRYRPSVSCSYDAPKLVVARKCASTVSAQFQKNLHCLLQMLQSTNPFFVRCIRSNVQKIPNMFDEATVRRQLISTGILGTVRVRQLGYSIRFLYEVFFQLYFPILQPRPSKNRAEIVGRLSELLESLQLPAGSYQLGHTRLFMREPVKQCLDQLLDAKLVRSAVLLQRWIRVVLPDRRRKRAVLIIQRYVRGFMCRRDYHREDTVRGYSGRQGFASMQRSSKLAEVTVSSAHSTDAAAAGVGAAAVSVDDGAAAVVVDDDADAAGAGIGTDSSRDNSVWVPAHHQCTAAGRPAVDAGAAVAPSIPAAAPLQPANMIGSGQDTCSVCGSASGSQCACAGTRAAEQRQRVCEHLLAAAKLFDRCDLVINDVFELTTLRSFISIKVSYHKLAAQKRGYETAVDRVFIQSLERLCKAMPGSDTRSRTGAAIRGAAATAAASTGAKDRLVAKKSTPACLLRCSDLVEDFVKILTCIVDEEKSDFSIITGVNALHTYINEFQQLMDSPKNKKSRKKRKSKKKKRLASTEEAALVVNGHSFSTITINIPTSCEVCPKPLLLMERGCVCANCKLICHKKCHTKVLVHCVRDQQGRPGEVRLFGEPLALVMNGDQLPVAIECLVCAIERRGLLVPGIYRKSGLKTIIDQLISDMDRDRDNFVVDESVSVHALTGALKTWLRRLPDPLLTERLYHDWLRAGQLPAGPDRVATVNQLLDQLPPANYTAVGQLLFHWSRVALSGADNLMSVGALAVVLSPCLLMSQRTVSAQELLINSKAANECVETLIAEHLRRLQLKLSAIDAMDASESRGATAAPDSDHQLCADARPERERKRRLSRALTALASRRCLVTDEECEEEEEDSGEELAARLALVNSGLC